ncbi:hypothetical protein TNCV_1738011 [Trichonephila clavipes]|nr:hypothetical protein TNCV_1738011 [Trichonephila clavipes]
MTSWEYTSIGLAWQLMRPDHSAVMPGWIPPVPMHWTRLTTSFFCLGGLGVKWSRSQARALDKLIKLYASKMFV